MLHIRRVYILGLVGASIGLCCICMFTLLITLNQVLPQLNKSINEFTSSLKGAELVGKIFLVMLEDGDWRRAYGMCTEELQGRYTSAIGLGEYIVKNNIKPKSWEFIQSISSTSHQFKLEGKITFSDNHPGTVELTLMRNNGGWKIDDFTLTRRE